MFDDLQYLLIASGYVGIFLWAFIEGEVGMVLAGSLAHQGIFQLQVGGSDRLHGWILR